MLNDAYREGRLWHHKRERERLRSKHPLKYLFWEATLNCNFFCEHCGSSAGHKVHHDELNKQEILNTFRQISKKYNPKKITIAVTGGEPLLRKDLFEIMKEAKTLGFYWGLVTNAYLLDEKTVMQLKDAGMGSISISIDGPKEIHDKFRHMPGSYDRAIKAIGFLSKAGIKKIQITTTITKKNIRLLDKMYQDFSKLPITSWRMMNVDPIGRAEGNKDILLDNNEFIKMMDFIVEKRKRSPFTVTYDCVGYLGDYEGRVRSHLFICLTGITVGSILHNGDIYVCPNVPRRKDLIQGNVRKDNFVDVWEDKFKSFRERERTSCEKCKACENWDECLGNGYHLWDTDKKEPKICHLEMLEKK